mmetsp:Transcript_79617/g.129042  ORF Transcript_79617/g.129042 Transcript_79617/m.129042 type:complete len:200 (-) Transcript_79617:1094-1693(-)
MCSRHGDAQLGGYHDCEHGAKFNAESTRRRRESQTVAERLHDMMAHRDEADVERHPTIHENPDGHGGLGLHLASLVDAPDGRKGTHSVGHVVGAMREREEAARRELEELEHLLHHRVCLESSGVQPSILLPLCTNVTVEARGKGFAKVLKAEGRAHDWHAVGRHLLLHAGVAAHRAHGLARVPHHLRLARELLLNRLLL